jgi:hypothetical protein
MTALGGKSGRSSSPAYGQPQSVRRAVIGQKRTLACYRCRPKAADGLSDNSFIAILELLAEG